jgi:hypothetical protein
MAEIRKVVRREALSDFQRVAPEGGGAFRALAQMAGTAYEYLKPAAIQEMTEEGSALGREIARQQIGNPRSGAVITASSKGEAHDHATHAGQSHADWLKYSNQGATRNDPLSPELVSSMSFLGDMGITMDVISGGQESNKPGEGTGSTRHNHGQSADVDFYKDGRKLDWNNASDLPLLQDIVGTAKSRGVTGIGAGDDYMGPGRFHIGFGAPAVWGAGGKGENAPSWLVEAYNGAPQGQAGTVSMSSKGGTTYVPTILREADGKLTSRLFSPMGGEILQAHNAAAGVAYQSEQLLQADIDIMGMSEQFALDPEGFQQAARGYLDDRIEKAPALFKEDLRNSLEREVQRRFLGILEDRQADTRKRADNSSAALADRWAGNLSSAIASGNPEEIATAQSELESILIARESLPGVAWTRVQTENAIMDAERRGQEEIQKRQREVSTEQKGQIKTIIDAAKGGMHSAYEGALADPAIAAAHPELVAEAQAQIALRDGLPSFFASPKGERDKAVADLKSTPISADYQLDIVKAAETANKSVTEAWEKDPIATAGQYLPQKPPALPSADSPDLIEGLAARHEYGLMLRDQGYTDKAIFLSDTEAESLGKMMSKDVPPEVRAAIAGAIVEGFGADAVQVFGEIKSDDPTTRFAGMLMASGRDAATSAIATEAMRGQAMIDERLVQPPTKASTVAAIDPNIAAALSAAGGAVQVESDLVSFASAIYAARAGNLDPSSEQAAELMKQAVQSALGQSTDKRGNVTGGVQVIGGNPTLLPVGVSGEKLEERMSEALGEFGGAWEAFGSIFGDTRKPDASIWAAAGVHSKSPPMLGGQPISQAQWTNGNIKLIPVSKNIYRMEQHTAGGAVSDVRDEKGNVYMMDVSRFLSGEAAPMPPVVNSTVGGGQ